MLCVVFKLITDTPDGSNVPCGRLGKLFTQSLDVDIDGTGITDIIIAPDII